MFSTTFIKQSRRIISVFAASFFISLSAQADPLEGIPSGEYPIDLSHASIVWKVNHHGFSTYVGRFTDFTSTLDLNAEDFSKSTVTVAIKTDSISTEFPHPEKEDFNKVLAQDWFKSGDTPEITFQSTSVSELNGNTATVTGDLSFHGQTHPLTLEVTLNKAVANHPFKKVPAIGFSAVTTLDRTAWGMSKYAPSIGADVRVEIEAEFLQSK